MDDIVTEIKQRLPAASTWMYIAIWGLSDMYKRMEESPTNPQFESISFPHTTIPLFTKEQAKKLEEIWPRLGQTGGQIGGFPPTLKDLAKGPKALGATMGAVFNNPDLLSIDKLLGNLVGFLDNVDDTLTDASKQYGLSALESVLPDIQFILPIGPIPLPVFIPARLMLPTLNILLELVRIASTILSPIEILGKPTTLLMVFLDLARGNLYHAIFTMLGMWGKYPMYSGILLKILRDAHMLISPDIRSELRSVVYRSGKSMVIGWMIWLFGIVAPEIVRKPIVALLDKVRNLVETYNDTVTKAEVKATAALKGIGYVEIPKMPSSRIPTIADLYILQEYIHNPNIYCHPDVVPLLKELRGIPPMALFLDLFNIPAEGTSEHTKACARIAEKSISQQLAPKITLF